MRGDGNPLECFKTARAQGFKFAAMHSNAECWGGNSFGKNGKSVNQTDCLKLCIGDKTSPRQFSCGNAWRMAIYSVTKTKYDAAAIKKIVDDAKAAKKAKDGAADIKLKAKMVKVKAAN